jgi:UDP:flavonoid glycosyltransferase YjiC (YdhE family)
LWNPKRGLTVVFDQKLIRKYLPLVVDRLREMNVPGETVLIGATMAYSVPLAHERFGIPFATVHLQPMSLCSVDDPPVHSTGSDFTWLPKPLIQLAYWGAEKWITDPLLATPINDYRASVNLPPVSRIITTWAPSKQCVIGLFPDWFAPIPDQGPAFHHTGFVPFDDAGGRPTPQAVHDFIAAGEPPVIFSFGSAMRTGRTYFEAAIEACTILGCRGILLGKSGDQMPTNLPSNVMQADYAPFSEVFPKASIVVHHAGIGTSAQAMKAGVPQLVMPMAFDQADNSVRMRRLGIARLLYPKKFTGRNVAKALKTIRNDAAMKEAAKSVSKKFEGVDSLSKVCDLLEQVK